VSGVDVPLGVFSLVKNPHANQLLIAAAGTLVDQGKWSSQKGEGLKGVGQSHVSSAVVAAIGRDDNGQCCVKGEGDCA
jgi:hypothetical protein